MLQRIETSTASGVPDVYFSVNGFNCWLETKTLDYEVTSQQVNWSTAHGKTGGKTYLITYAPDAPQAPQQRSTNKTHTLAPPQYPEQLQGRPISAETAQRDVKAGTQVRDGSTGRSLTGEYYDWENPSRKIRGKQLVILEFTNTIDDYSTLGAYIKKEKPHMEALEDWLKRVTS